MITLKAQKREVFGKQTKKLREEGLVPAELYGKGVPNIHLSVPAKEFAQVYKEAGEHSVLYVEVDGESHPVLIHGVEENRIGPGILAIDFHKIRMDEKVKAHVPLTFEGEAPAVKEKEGILTKSMDEIEVEALPADLPHSIRVDLSGLVDLDKSLYVKDLPKSDKYEYVIDEETVVASVTARREEAEEVLPVAGEAAPEGEGVASDSDKTGEGAEKEDETKT